MTPNGNCRKKEEDTSHNPEPCAPCTKPNTSHIYNVHAFVVHKNVCWFDVTQIIPFLDLHCCITYSNIWKTNPAKAIIQNRSVQTQTIISGFIYVIFVCWSSFTEVFKLGQLCQEWQWCGMAVTHQLQSSFFFYCTSDRISTFVFTQLQMQRAWVHPPKKHSHIYTHRHLWV